MKRCFIFTLLLLASFHVHAIVTVSNLRFDDSNPGFVGSVEAEFWGASGNSDISAWHLGSDLVWRTPRYINLMLFGYNYGRSNNATNINKTFIHARHIHQYNSTFDWELFAQLEKNEFTRLSSRELIGSGLRFPVRDNVFLGIGALYYKEILDEIAGLTDDLNDNGVRINSYWSGDYKYNDISTFKTRLYYQPKIDEFADYRVLFNGSLTVNMSNKFGLKLSVGVVHDNKPPQGVEDTDVTYRSGIEYNF